MIIEVKSRFTGKIIFSREAESLKQALEAEVKSGSNLYGSNLSGSDLSGSNLSGSNLSGSNLSGSNLSGSDLSGSNLSGSNLSGSNLYGSDLSRSDLSGSKNYSGVHEIAYEVIRRQNVEFFISLEWEIIGKIAMHRPCWPKIKEMFGDSIFSILQKLADLGFGEYLEHYKGL